MRKTLAALALLMLFPTSPSFAGATKAGDGGNVVSCQTQYSKVVRFFDLVEEQRFPAYATALDLSVDVEPDLTSAEFFARAEQRATEALGQGHPFLKFIELAQSWQISPFIFTYHVFHTDDTGFTPFMTPGNCRIENVGYRSRIKDYLELNLTMWNLLPQKDRVALLLHEAIHRWFASNLYTIAERESVRYLLSPEISIENAAKFRHLITVGGLD